METPPPPPSKFFLVSRGFTFSRKAKGEIVFFGSDFFCKIQLFAARHNFLSECSNTVTWSCTVYVVYLTLMPLLALVIACSMCPANLLQCTRKNETVCSWKKIKIFSSILFYSILFYSILFYSILFYSILFYSILFSS